MPYKKTTDLPDSVKNHLPEKARRIFLEAFNHSYAKEHDEILSFKIAWGAVKKSYEKGNDGMWHKSKKRAA